MVPVFRLNKVQGRIIQHVEVRCQEEHIVFRISQPVILAQQLIPVDGFHLQVDSGCRQVLNQCALQFRACCASLSVSQCQLQRHQAVICLLITNLVCFRIKGFTVFIQVPARAVQQLRCLAGIHVIRFDIFQAQFLPFRDGLLVFFPGLRVSLFIRLFHRILY